MKGLLVVISGFSGAGKGTLVRRLLQDYDNYALSVSMTTRGIREGEVDKKDYFFVSREEFENTISQGGLIEHAQYCGNYYGTPRAYVEQKLKEGKNVLLEIEVQGAMQIKEKFPDTLLIFVTPPSAAVLEKRLRGRGTEDEATIKRRLERAGEEAASMEKYEFLAINDDLDTCVKEVNDMVMSARFSTSRCHDFISEITSEVEAF